MTGVLKDIHADFPSIHPVSTLPLGTVTSGISTIDPFGTLMTISFDTVSNLNVTHTPSNLE